MKRLAALAGLASAAVLAGCGFTPMYAAPGVASGMSHIQVVVPQGRVGYLVRQSLDDSLGHEKGGDAIYRLDLTFNQNRQAHGLNADDTAQRYELDLKVTYNLVQISNSTVLHSGYAVSNISYDSTDQPYAGIAARQDVQDRLASDVAQKIEVQVAAWLATHPQS